MILFGSVSMQIHSLVGRYIIIFFFPVSETELKWADGLEAKNISAI